MAPRMESGVPVSVETRVSMWCDWPGCGKGVRGKGGETVEAVREEAAERFNWWTHDGRDYCPKHVAQARRNAEEAESGT